MSVKKRANPEASGDSTFKLHESVMQCCNGEKLSTAKYTVDINFEANINSITVTVDGVDKEIELGLSGSVGTPITKKALRLAVAKALKDNGYDPYYTDDNLVGVVTDGSTLRVLGEAVLKSIKNPTTKNFAAATTQARIVVSRFNLAQDGDGALLKYKGSAGTLLDDSATTSAAGAVTEFESALTTEGVQFTKVVASLSDEVLTVDIHSLAESEDLNYDGVDANTVRVYPDYI